MELVRPDIYINFMKFRAPVAGGLLLLAGLSIAAFFFPGPRYGIDFAGGTEIQVAFKEEVDSHELRAALEGAGYERPDVIAVEGASDEFLIRVGAVSSLSAAEVATLSDSLVTLLGADVVNETRVSPGGDKVTLRLSRETELSTIEDALRAGGAQVRDVLRLEGASDVRYEAHLVGVGDDVMSALQKAFPGQAPDVARRIEWVGPKAGEQLRNAAVLSMVYALAFIMLYVAFRFDLRFAPGGVIAMVHDAIITLGVYIVLNKEINLTTVAAVLTVMGYSINDTIVVYDRIRENMARYRDRSLADIINLSTSQTLSRTLITGFTTLLSVSAFMVIGTAAVADIAFALVIGIGIGTVSSIFVAAPVTEWLDSRYFRRLAKRA